MAIIQTFDLRGNNLMSAPFPLRRFLVLATLLLGSVLTAAPILALPELHYAVRPGPVTIQSLPPLPSPATYPVQLVLDDDSWEGTFGVGGVSSEEFLWFNRFTSPGDFTLQEIWVLFPQVQAAVADEIQLVAYRDTDGNISNGAEFLAAWTAEVLVADNNTFSVYELATPLEIPGGGEVWIGVINRWVIPGVTPLAFPATIDSNSNLGLSGFAFWPGTPPNPPDLASASSILNLNSTPAAGTFLIRAFGSSLPIVDVPALDVRRLALFAVLLTLAATFALGLRRA